MATVLQELGALHLTRPGPYASDAEVGAWQERRAVMLDHVAAEGGLGLDADRASALALAAHERAARLLARSTFYVVPGRWRLRQEPLPARVSQPTRDHRED